MKNVLKTLSLFLAIVLLSFNAFSAEKNRIAVLDMQLVMNGTKMAKAKQADLKRRSQKAQKRILKMEESFKKRVEDLERKKSILSEDKFIEEQSELRRVSREHQGEVQTINEKFGREYKRIQKEISDEVDVVVKDIAKERGFDMVMAKSYLLYSSKAIDISDDVLKRVDKVLAKKSKKKGL